jgi:GNAT superfamily N-acetyltransferase
MQIRPLTAKDKPHWLRLFKGYNEFYAASVPPDVVEDLWQRLLRGGPGDHVGLVAVDAEDRPVGLAHILFHASSWAIAPDCYLEDLYVDPARRKSGIGRMLIAAVYAEADARGARRTYWMTQETNATARRLYDQVAKKSDFVQYRR